MAEAEIVNYILDLGTLFREKALEAKLSAAESSDGYELGRLMAFHEMISLMRSQAELFNLSFADIGLEGLEPDRDLL